MGYWVRITPQDCTELEAWDVPHEMRGPKFSAPISVNLDEQSCIKHIAVQGSEDVIFTLVLQVQDVGEIYIWNQELVKTIERWLQSQYIGGGDLWFVGK